MDFNAFLPHVKKTHACMLLRSFHVLLLPAVSLFSFPFIVFQLGRRFQSAVRRLQVASCRSEVASRWLQCDSCNAKVALLCNPYVAATDEKGATVYGFQGAFITFAYDAELINARLVAARKLQCGGCSAEDACGGCSAKVPVRRFVYVCSLQF